MIYCRLFVAITFLIFISCNNSDGQFDYTPPEISVTKFITTKNRVELSWEINKGSDIIIEDLFVIRRAEDLEYPIYFKDVKTNMPSTSTMFVDDDIPYWNKLSYQVILNYREKEGGKNSLVVIESEKTLFSRKFPRFDRVPFQIIKDPINPDIFHISEISAKATLNRYSFNLDEILKRFTITENYYDFYNRFVFHDRNLLVADLRGNVHLLRSDTYDVIEKYDTKVPEKLGSVGIIDDRLYFLNDNQWFDYLILGSLEIKNHGLGPGFRNFKILDGKKLLYLYSGTHNSGGAIYEFGPDLDEGYGWDFSLTRTKDTYELDLDGDDVDQFNVAFNEEKTIFVSGIDGHIFHLNDLSLKAVLNEQTGKKYFGYTFDSEGNLYASVQKERKIHVFDSDDFDLKEVIDTKLFPLYPMISGGGFKCVGSYEQVEYWGYDFGYSYGFNSICAIEDFE